MIQDSYPIDSKESLRKQCAQVLVLPLFAGQATQKGNNQHPFWRQSLVGPD